MSFWENQLQKVKEGKSPALTIEQQQEREKPELAMQENKPVEQAAQTDDGVGFGDVAKAAASGVVGWAESNAEIALTPESRKAVSATVPGMLLGLADYVPVIRDTLVNAKRQTQEQFAETKQGIKTSMSASARKALEAELINDNLEFTDDATKLSTWIMKGTETIARMVPDLVAGGLVGKELYQSSYDLAFQNGMAKGLTETGAKIAANKIANAAMMAPTAIASTMSSQGSAGVQVRQTIENLPWKDLAQSDTFKQSFAQINADPANAEMSNKDKLNLARTMTAETASKDIIDDPALLTVNALASFIGDATLGKMIAGKMSGGIASKVIKGAVAEGATEAPQGAMEQYAQNLTLIDVAGQDIAPSKGVAKSAAEGGLMGAVIGGGMGGGSGAVDSFTGRPSEGTPTETIPAEDVTAETDIVPTEEKPVAQRREELEQRLDQQREEARQERVISGEGEAQQALAAGKVSPTAEELIQAAPSQPKETPMEYGLNRATIMQKEMDEFIQGRKAPTVAERRANLEKRLEQQRAEMDRQRVETGTGEVQARLSRPAEPTAEELILKAPEESGPTPGELEFRQQSEQNYIEKAKDAKIPPGLKGRPNAVKLMNVGYRNALSDFGGLSERMAKNTGPSAEVDTMSDVIAKMGGLSRKVAETEGFDPAAIKGNKAFSAKGKLDFDSAAKKLNELGFENRQGKPLSGNDVIDMIYGEANNAEAHYSKQALPEMMTGDARLTKVWAEQIGGADKLNVAVKKALNNEPLGKRQADVIEDMLDTINTMRTESVGKAKEKLSQIRAERSSKRVSDFNKLMSDATGESNHLQDAQSYADVISEMPDNYTEEQVILDELVSTAGDADFESTKGAIEQYESGTVSLPNLLTQLGDIAKKRVKTNAETKPAIQEISKPAAPAVEAVVTERVEPSPTAPAVEPVAERAGAGTERTEPVTEQAEPEVEPAKEAAEPETSTENEYSFDEISRIREGMGSLALQEFGGSMAAKKARDIAGRIWAEMAGGKTYAEVAEKERSANEIGMKMFEDAAKKVSEKVIASDNLVKSTETKPKAKTKPKPAQDEAPAAEQPTTVEVQPILEMTKAKWVQGEVKKKGIKKGSPGYDDALAKINDSYENEVDKALALSTFETYQKFNSDTPESINRMAYDELRKEFGTDEANKVSFDKSSIVTGTKKGMPLKEVDLVSKAFLKEYKGAAGVKVVVFKTQQEAMDYVGVPMDDDVTISGMHIPMSNEVVLIADNLDSPSDALKTLRHEILAHHGLLKVVGQNEWEAVTDLVSASRNASSLKDVWAEIDRNYEGTSESRKAEEVIAKIAEESPGKFGEWGNRIVAAVIRALRRVRFIRDKITETEIKDMIRIIGERMKNLSVAEARIRSDINFSKQLTAESGFSIPDETRKDAFIRSIADKYRRLKIVQESIKEQGGNIGEQQDVYIAEELFHGKTGEDLRVIETDYIKPLQEFMSANDIEAGELDLYLIANHAKERNEQIASINPDMPDGGSGMTNAESEAIMKKFSDEGTKQKLEKAADFVYGMLNNTKQRMIDSGLETQDAVDSWDSAYKNYVPLKGFAVDEFNEKGDSIKATGKGFNIRGKETMRAMGRSSIAESPLAYAISDATQSTIRARKNEVAQSMLRLVDANPDPDLWEVFSNENPDMTRRISKSKDPVTGKTIQTVINVPMPMHAMKDKYLGVKMGGEQYYIKLNDVRLMEAMANLGVEQTNIMTQTLGRATRMLSALITSYNPEFMFSNFARDIQTAVFNVMAESQIKGGKAEGTKDLAQQVVKDIPASMKALKLGLRNNKFEGEWGKYFKEYLGSGAKTGWFVQKDIEEIKSDIQRSITITGPGAVNALLRSKDKVIKFVDDYNDIVENATRLSAYVNSRKQGLTIQQSASLAKNLTVNFNRRGEMSNSINALYMFFNASVQGTVNMLRAVATPKDKSKGIFNPDFYNTTQKIAMALPIATMVMAAVNREIGGDDDDGKSYYDKVPNYVKETNFVIMIPGSDGDFIKIPMPYGYNFFSAVGTAIDNSINGEASAVEGAFDIVASFAGAFSPLGHTDSKEMSVQALKMVSPTLLKPVIEMSVNENFSGSPIYKEQNPFGLAMPDSYNAQRRTWEWAKGTSQWLNDLTGGNQFKSGVVDIAPESFQHILSFMGGGLGSLILKTQDVAAKSVKGEDVETKDVPFMRKYFGSISDSVDVSEFYQRFDAIQIIEKQLTGLPLKERKEFRTENKDKIKLIPLATTIKKEMQKLGKIRNQIDASNMSDERKKARIEKLEERKRFLASKFNAAYNKAIAK